MYDSYPETEIYYLVIQYDENGSNDNDWNMSLNSLSQN